MVTEAQAVREAVLSAARQMCAAARTAPKACGADSIVTAVLTDHELHALADRMEQIESQRERRISRSSAGTPPLWRPARRWC